MATGPAILRPLKVGNGGNMTDAFCVIIMTINSPH